MYKRQEEGTNNEEEAGHHKTGKGKGKDKQQHNAGDDLRSPTTPANDEEMLDDEIEVDLGSLKAALASLETMLGAQAPAVIALQQKVAIEEERKNTNTPLPSRLQKVHTGLANLGTVAKARRTTCRC